MYISRAMAFLIAEFAILVSMVIGKPSKLGKQNLQQQQQSLFVLTLAQK